MHSCLFSRPLSQDFVLTSIDSQEQGTEFPLLSSFVDPVHSAIKNTETSGVYCMNPHKELIIHIKDTVIQYPYIVPVSSHIPTYVPSMIPNT